MLDFHNNLKTTYEPTNDYEPKYPPSAVVVNSRSLYNKAKNLKLILNELDLDVALISETWEQVLPNLEMLIDSETYNVISKKELITHTQVVELQSWLRKPIIFLTLTLTPLKA